jgi:hypothetical protein
MNDYDPATRKASSLDTSVKSALGKLKTGSIKNTCLQLIEKEFMRKSTQPPRNLPPQTGSGSPEIPRVDRDNDHRRCVFRKGGYGFAVRIRTKYSMRAFSCG